MRLPTYETTDDAYRAALEAVYYTPTKGVNPRAQVTREIINAGFEVSRPTSRPIRTTDATRNRVIAKYTANEMELYYSGEKRASEFARASRFWSGLANPDGTINSAYGWLILKNESCGRADWDAVGEVRTPWEWAASCLLEDSATRQATMPVALPEHRWSGNRDQVCTMHVSFMIRDGLLRTSVVMRSNDVVRGLVYDVPFFVSLGERMVEELARRAPRTFRELKVGPYCHFAHSLHMYESDKEMVERILDVPEHARREVQTQMEREIQNDDED